MERPTAELKINEDGQFEIHVMTSWGPTTIVLSRAVSKDRAEKLLKIQKVSAMVTASEEGPEGRPKEALDPDKAN